MGMQVLLIGGTRFLGQAIAESFIQNGHNVYLMNRGTRSAVPGAAEQLVCDKADRTAFADVLNKHTWDVVIDTILDDSDLNFVIEAAQGQIGHFIHTGSLGVYGEAKKIPAPESMPLAEYHGTEIVFNYKIKQDQVLWRAFQEKSFPATILRMSYIYGPGDIPLDGWGGRSLEFFRLLRDGQKPPLPGEGRALLHPGHVNDLGRAFLHAAERRSAAIGQIYNIAGEFALMTRDYVTMIAQAMEVKAEFSYAEPAEILARYPKDTSERGMQFACQHMCASIQKAGRDLDWYPKIPLENGLRQNVDWLREKHKL